MEFLISVYTPVKYFNCMLATKEYDSWAFAIVLMHLEGYFSCYQNYFLNPA